MFFEHATLKNSGERLVTKSKTIYTNKEKSENTLFLFSPLVVLTILAVIIVFITFKDYKSQLRTKWLDVIIFITTGIVGVLVFLLWFATDHTSTAYNYNLLWAFPLSLFCVLQLVKTTPKKWCIGYIKFLMLMLCLMTLHWAIGVQRFAPALIPVLIALAIRYVFLLKHFKTTA